MVDIWSFGMVILELVTQQAPYLECKGAFQAYQAIINGKKPLILEQIHNKYIKSFIDICLNPNPKCRPTANELLDHPFLFERVADRQLCYKCIKPKKKHLSMQYPEPPGSPQKIITNTNDANDANDDIKEVTPINLTPTPPIISPNRTRSKSPPTPTTNNTNSSSKTLSSEKVFVQQVNVNNNDPNKIKLTMQIFSNSFSEKIITVEFDYDFNKDKPEGVAKEMVQALKLQSHFINKIQTAIINAIPSKKDNENSNSNHNSNDDINVKSIPNRNGHSNSKSNKDQRSKPKPLQSRSSSPKEIKHAHDQKEGESESKHDRYNGEQKNGHNEDNQMQMEMERTMTVTANMNNIVNDTMGLQRALSKESMKLREKQDTELWLTENGLSELIPCFNKEGLTIEHLRDITNDMIKDICDQFNWNIVIRLKLQKAVQDLKPIKQPSISQDRLMQEQYTQEQTLILDELSQKHNLISNDIKQIKDAINGMLSYFFLCL